MPESDKALTPPASIGVVYIDAGEQVHREIRVEGVAQPFTTESCQRDQTKGAAALTAADALDLVELGERGWCDYCCADLKAGA